MRIFSDFLQGLGRTTAQDKLDPSLSKLASPEIVKYIQGFVEPGSVQGVGSKTVTVNKVETLPFWSYPVHWLPSVAARPGPQGLAPTSWTPRPRSTHP